MGNVHTIQQFKPTWNPFGAVILVKRGFQDIVTEKHAPVGDHYRTWIKEIEVDFDLPNLGPRDGCLREKMVWFVLQSGHKMWCGVEEFISHIRDFSPCLEDALFYIHDEYRMVYEFVIKDGQLEYDIVSDDSTTAEYIWNQNRSRTTLYMLLLERAWGACELCRYKERPENFRIWSLSDPNDLEPDQKALLCRPCYDAVAGGIVHQRLAEKLAKNAVYSDYPVVKVIAENLFQRIRDER